MNLWRRLRLVWLRRYRAANPMCSRCGCRVESSPNQPPECMCRYLAIIAKAQR